MELITLVRTVFMDGVLLEVIISYRRHTTDSKFRDFNSLLHHIYYKK